MNYFFCHELFFCYMTKVAAKNGRPVPIKAVGVRIYNLERPRELFLTFLVLAWRHSHHFSERCIEYRLGIEAAFVSQAEQGNVGI